MPVSSARSGYSLNRMIPACELHHCVSNRGHSLEGAWQCKKPMGVTTGNFYMNTAMHRFLTRFALLILMEGIACSAVAAGQPLQTIRDTAINYVRSHSATSGVDTGISAKHLDARLRLPLCQSPLQAFYPHAARKSGNITVGVRCDGSKPWTIYVPVVVQIYRDIAIATRSLPRNKILTGDDIQLQRMDISRLSGAYITDPGQIAGKQLKRPLQTGTPLLSSMLKQPIVIRRGEMVTLLAKRRRFEIRMEGKALMDGAAGDRIRVRNLRSKRIIEGKLAQGGTVLVN